MVDQTCPLCACGCGETADTTVRLLPEQHRGTADALGWAELSIDPMREDVAIVDGHDEDGIDGYVAGEVRREVEVCS